MDIEELKQFIIDNLITKSGKINPHFTKEKWWIDNGIDYSVFQHINSLYSTYPNAKTQIQLLYDIVNDIKEIQYCDVCKINQKIFYNFVQGYRHCCSSKCSKKHPNFNENRKKTTLEKYGVEHTSQLDSEKARRKETCIKKYGVPHHTKNKKVQEKRVKTTLEKYGVEHISKLQEIKDKKKETCFVNYGVENPSQSKDIQDSKIKTNLERYGVEYYSKTKEFRDSVCLDFPILKDKEWLEEQHKTKSTVEIAKELGTTATKVLCWIKNHGIEHKIYNVRSQQKEIQAYLDSINVRYKVNDRNSIKPKELDVHVTDYKFAIEVNGVYWHQEQKVGKTYHVDKLKLCEDNNIKLIQLWDFEWDSKKEICKSVINSFLNKNDKIYARETVVKIISSKKCREFLDNNHLQGYCRSKIKLGLFYKNELVSAMTFGKPRFNKKYQWELIRFCNKLNTNVVGGASKLFNKFLERCSPDNVISYNDKRVFSGGIYKTLGFNFLYDSELNYFYFKNGKTLSRYDCQKHKLTEILKDDFDETLTERENMLNNGWYDIYDCGNGVWEYMRK